jgi:hypothetical protein
MNARKRGYQLTSAMTAKVHSWQTTRMKRFLERSILLHILITLVSIMMGSIELSKVFAGGDIVVTHMWSSIVILLTASFVELINLCGYYAVKFENHILLLVYIVSLTFMVLLLLCLSFVVFVNSSYVDVDLFDQLQGEQQIGSDAVAALWEYNIVLGISCILVTVFALVPLFVSYIYERRLRDEVRILFTLLCLFVRFLCILGRFGLS